MFVFLGSTIGNFNHTDFPRFFRALSAAMGPRDFLLLGADRVKPAKILEDAYNDSRGVTADFNFNILHHLNRRLGQSFDLDRFEHIAFYNPALGRIEMHLRALESHTVNVRGEEIRFRMGETIHTENSYKFSCEEMGEMAGRAGLEVERQWTDRQQRFCLQFLVARG